MTLLVLKLSILPGVVVKPLHLLGLKLRFVVTHPHHNVFGFLVIKKNKKTKRGSSPLARAVEKFQVREQLTPRKAQYT